jgi:hypothetical protein
MISMAVWAKQVGNWEKKSVMSLCLSFSFSQVFTLVFLQLVHTPCKLMICHKAHFLYLTTLVHFCYSLYHIKTAIAIILYKYLLGKYIGQMRAKGVLLPGTVVLWYFYLWLCKEYVPNIYAFLPKDWDYLPQKLRFFLLVWEKDVAISNILWYCI